MKLLKQTTLLMLVFSTFLVACQKEYRYGLDKDLATPLDLSYDEVNSTSTDLSITWNAETAISEGAVSFTVELLKTELGYDANPIKQIVLVKDEINDAALFMGLRDSEKFYVRARANYPGARYSGWVYLKDQDKPAVVKVGMGIVDEPID